jgi:hypothetical protein
MQLQQQRGTRAATNLCTSSPLKVNCGWAQEAALYIEAGAHMAPNAIDLLFRRGSKKR